MAKKKANWNEVACPKCKQPLNVAASRCPHCQAEFTDAEVAARKKEHRGGLMFGCGFLILVMLTLGWCVSRGDDGESAISTGSAKGDAIALYKEVIRIVEPCDAAMTSVAKVSEQHDVVAAYRAVEQADKVCLSTGTDIKAIGVPASFDDENKDMAKKTLDICHDAYLNKWAGAHKFKEILDGDNSVSAQAELQDIMQNIKSGSTICVGGLVSLATAQGATEVDLGLDGAK